MEARDHIVELFHEAIEWASLGIEILAVAVIVTGVALVAIRTGTIRYVFHMQQQGALQSYKQQLGKPLLLGLELLVAADVIETVALDPTFSNVGVLGVLVLVRTILSWSLAVEMEGRWPWQHESTASSSPRDGA